MTSHLQILNASFSLGKKRFSYKFISLAIFGDGEGKNQV